MARQSAVKVLQPAAAALAGFYLSMLGCLVLWAVVPLALGWQVTVAMSGSMEPSIKTGDILVAEPAGPDSLKPGMVPLAVNPLQRSTLYTHRIVNVLPDGRLVTKGDNNGSLDPEPLKTSEVRGVERLRVPMIGIPLQAVRTGNPLPMSVFVLVTAAAAVIVWDDEKRTARERSATQAAPRGRRRASGTTAVYSTRKEARRARQRERSASVRILGRITTAMALAAALVVGSSTAMFNATTMPPRSSWSASASFGSTGSTTVTCGGAVYTPSANTTLTCTPGTVSGTTTNYTLVIKGTGALVQWGVAADWSGVAKFSYAKAYGTGVSDTGNIATATGYTIHGNANGSTNPADSWNHAWISSAKAAETFTVQVTTT